LSRNAQIQGSDTLGKTPATVWGRYRDCCICRPESERYRWSRRLFTRGWDAYFDFARRASRLRIDSPHTNIWTISRCEVPEGIFHLVATRQGVRQRPVCWMHQTSQDGTFGRREIGRS